MGQIERPSLRHLWCQRPQAKLSICCTRQHAPPRSWNILRISGQTWLHDYHDWSISVIKLSYCFHVPPVAPHSPKKTAPFFSTFFEKVRFLHTVHFGWRSFPRLGPVAQKSYAQNISKKTQLFRIFRYQINCLNTQQALICSLVFTEQKNASEYGLQERRT